MIYRFAVFPIHIPPLRKRGNDGELLALHFLREPNDKHNAHKSLSRGALKAIRSYTWPGNIRELKNAIQRAFILSSDVVDIERYTTDSSACNVMLHDGCVNFPVGTPLADVQREIILATLMHFSGNKQLTAEVLGISIKTLYNRLKDY